MNNVSSVVNSGAVYSNSNVNQTTNSEKTIATDKTTSKKTVSGKTIGNPQLSEKASKYYESLKKKYSNMDFILVSADKKEQAKSQAASYANANKMVVLIDEEKIEKMAEDEKFRKQYEGIIANAASGMSQLKSQLESSGANVKGFGMQVNDNGVASYFAVLEKSSLAQKARIEKKAAENKEAKKAEDRKARKKEQQERLEKSRNESGKISKEDSDTVTVTASSIEELLQKIKDQSQLFMSDNVQTDVEKQVGQKFDFSV